MFYVEKVLAFIIMKSFQSKNKISAFWTLFHSVLALFLLFHSEIIPWLLNSVYQYVYLVLMFSLSVFMTKFIWSKVLFCES